MFNVRSFLFFVGSSTFDVPRSLSAHLPMILKPSSPEDLCRQLVDVHGRGEKVSAFRLDALNRVLEHTPEDMTITVEAGITFSALQKQLAVHSQWLPMDPPHPDRTSIGAILAGHVSGPRRCGYGTIRDYLIGMRFALADGTVVKSGGKVVKNVAGFDLCKLLIGSEGSLGVIFEATFKLRPLPEVERVLEFRCDSLEQADALLKAILLSQTTPVVLDLHNLSDSFSLVVGFDGMKQDVEWQVAELKKIGAAVDSDLGYHARFHGGEGEIRHLSVLPTSLAESIRRLGKVSFVTHAGNGVIQYRGGEVVSRSGLPMELMKRVKDAYDPKGILPGLKVGR